MQYDYIIIRKNNIPTLRRSLQKNFEMGKFSREKILWEPTATPVLQHYCLNTSKKTLIWIKCRLFELVVDLVGVVEY